MRKVLCFIATEGAGHTGPGTPYEAKWLDENGRMASRKIARPHMLAEYFKHSNQIDKHNHARQSQLALEKNIVTQDGYFRLWCTYLGITVTDAWKVYRHHLGERCGNKNISILSFCNILIRTHLLNDYSESQYESTPHPPLPRLDEPNSSRDLALSLPEQICTNSNESAFSSLGTCTSTGLIMIGNGKYIPSTFVAPHSLATCNPTDQYVKSGKGSYSDRRRKRNRCRVCGTNTTMQCSVCQQWVYSSSTAQKKTCFIQHGNTNVTIGRETYWRSLQQN